MALTSATNTASTAIQNQVYALMANDRIPLQRLQTQKSDLATRTQQFQALGSKLSSLLTLARTLSATGSTNPLRSITVTGGDPAAFTVTTDGSAQRGSHTVEVAQIATRHAIASVPIDSTAPDAGSQKSAADGGAGHASFRVTAGGTVQEYSVDFPAGATTGEAMAAIAAAVNVAQGPVTAGVLDQGNGRLRLVIQSATTGAAARITAVEDVEGSWMADLGLVGQEQGDSALASTVQTAADARLRVDGVEVVTPENAVRNLLPGVSLELHSVSPAVAVSVEQDADAVVKQVQGFIDKYNAAVDQVRTLTQGADETGANRGIFTSDPMVSRLRTALRDAVALPVSPENSVRSLADVGVTTDRSGHLSLADEGKLRSVIDTDAQGVESLFTGSGGVANRLAKLLDGYGPTGTTYTRQLESWRTQGRSLDSRIARENTTLARRQAALTAQLAQMQATVASLTSQQNYLTGLLASGDNLFA
jgi:flagellar hook-associated protein 2